MKYIKIIGVLVLSIFMVGCGRNLNNITSKTSFEINETAKIDKLEITLINVNEIGNDTIEFII